MKKILTLLISITISVASFGQGQGNIWHFGLGAGIDFNSGTAVAINSPMNSFEGCATMCNAAGSLLFSTSGEWVFNSAGGGMCYGLYGSSISSQSSLIVPFPGNSNKFYIFTTPYTSFGGGNLGFDYSVVDMTLNGGLGAIIDSNIVLLSNSCEKVTGVRHTNGTDYWVIMHAYPTNEFYVYPVTGSGIGTPVITAIGLPISDYTYTGGYLKCSPNGQKLVSARDGAVSEPIELFDFNASTGEISNYLPIPNNAHRSYGASFSPDNSKLYVSITPGLTDIIQYDLTVPNFQSFPYNVHSTNTPSLGALQLAPDGKIYYAKSNHNNLGVINNPNLAGAACNYVDSGFFLISGATSKMGLPNFIDSYFGSTGSGILTIQSENNFNIYPNPCTTCEITGATNATDLMVTDILGRKQNASFSKSAKGYYIHLPEASTGLFLIRNIKTGEVVKFVRE